MGFQTSFGFFGFFWVFWVFLEKGVESTFLNIPDHLRPTCFLHFFREISPIKKKKGSLNKDTDMSIRPFSPIIGSKHCSKHYTNWQGLFSHVGILIEGTIVLTLRIFFTFGILILVKKSAKTNFKRAKISFKIH